MQVAMNYYNIIFYDNDTCFLKKTSAIVCSSCNMYLNKRQLIDKYITNYKSKRRKSHFLCTYDGFQIVSQEFKNLYNAQQWKGLIFHEIPKNKGFYIIECENSIPYDKTCLSIKEKCHQCGQYKSVCVKDCFRVIAPSLSENTFYRTDWEFAYDFEQHYVIFCSEKIATILIENELAIKKDFLKIEVIAIKK